MYIDFEPVIAIDQSPSDAYHRGYLDGWADADAARLREENSDLREIIRVGNERLTGPRKEQH